MAEHLTRAFFETELEGLAEQYAADAGVRQVVTELMLRNGSALRIEGKPVCTDQYIAVDYKSGTQLCRAVIPYGAVVGVGFSPDSSGTVGFHR